jgi:hypothetical protein
MLFMHGRMSAFCMAVWDFLDGKLQWICIERGNPISCVPLDFFFCGYINDVGRVCATAASHVCPAYKYVA